MVENKSRNAKLYKKGWGLMDLSLELQIEIDKMPYEEMLRRWRYAPVGDEMFQGESGVYFGDVMWKKRDAMSPGGAVRASKNVGWGKDKE